MLRSFLRSSRPTSYRTFVSSVLLSKTWENETVADIKKELRKRSLSQSGNKSILISRIMEDDKRVQLKTLSTPVQQRRASTAGSSPGIPAAAEATTRSAAADFLATRLPDIPSSSPETSIQIPLLPDYWDSSNFETVAYPPDSSEPKMITMSGPDTYLGGGPSHNLYQMSDDSSVSSTTSGMWSDVVHEIGLTSSISSIQKQFAEQGPSSSVPDEHYSRDLNPDEVRGLWMLLGLFTGLWIVAGIAKPSSKLESKPVKKQKTRID